MVRHSWFFLEPGSVFALPQISAPPYKGEIITYSVCQSHTLRVFVKRAARASGAQVFDT
jgi:hypothetical protein